jgi:site-specific recombinase XerD
MQAAYGSLPSRRGARLRAHNSSGASIDSRYIRRYSSSHTFASWYMMNGGDLYELAKILGHANIKMTERYAKLGRQHIANTGSTAREIWKLFEQEKGNKEDIA